jgi:type II secretory pathway component PulJ
MKVNRRSKTEGRSRRGITLVEMLVTVAILVIIMTVMVQVFQAATGSLSTAQIIHELDNKLKLVDGMLRADLAGATATFTPPLDPEMNKGYFEYIENEFADTQGEDSDDILKFTAKAPSGQPFTGRMWVTMPALQTGMYTTNQPVTITSEYAEIIYFLRNGNLYRRVLLIAPELQSAIVSTEGNGGWLPTIPPTPQPFAPPVLGGIHVSWQGVNDLSAHPAVRGPNTSLANTPAAWAAQTVVLNTLGSLTNRENRYAAPRFSDDFSDHLNNFNPDGFSDDYNGDKVPDIYPTMYPNVFNTGLINPIHQFTPLLFTTVPSHSTVLPFPYLFPGSYSVPQVLNNDQYGWIHSPSPLANHVDPITGLSTAVQFDTNPLPYLQAINHNPLDVGDNLPTPQAISGTPGATQTWWGLPTWRETLSRGWQDPTRQVNDNSPTFAGQFGQPNGLTPRPANVVPVSPNDNQLLPWMGNPLTVAQGGTFPNAFDFSFIRRTPQLFSDATGYHQMSVILGAAGAINQVWSVSWEDDLIMTGVRSFDVKAYDNAFAGYADLGWGDDLRLYLAYRNTPGYLFAGNNPPVPAAPPGLAQTPPGTIWPPLTTGSTFPTLSTMAHEGRMPPVTADLRFDPQQSGPVHSAYNYSGNIGDDAPGVVRMRRIWDTWSTEYTQAPATGLAPPLAGGVSSGMQVGPVTGYPLPVVNGNNYFTPAPPLYPSYPAPYPAPLRGIQIQIRVADPTNQRVKSLTIRQDFTDKLQ